MTRRDVASGLALMAVALTVSLLGVEIVLRVYAGVSESHLARTLRVDPFAVLVEPHGEVGFRPKPNTSFAYPNGTRANTNAQGFRGPTVTIPKPEGTFRVLLFGGSTTFGWGANDGETIDAYMREILAERYPGRAIDVVSLAFDGYDSYQHLERLRSDGLALEPDAVIMNDGINDVQNAWYQDLQDGDRRTLLYRATMDYLRFEQARGGPTLGSRMKHYTYLARLPGWIRQRLMLAAGTVGPPQETAPPYYWDAVDYFDRNIRRMVDLSVEAGAVVLLSTPPSSLRTRYQPTHPPERTYWILNAEITQVYRDSLSARLQAAASEAQADKQPVTFVEHPSFATDLFLDDAHLTPDGNRRIAEDFVNALEPWLTEATHRTP